MSAAGTPFGKLRLLEVLGRGGMGVVWKAEQLDLGRTVAVKLLHPEDEADPLMVARFLGEARAAARLSHPNIVCIHEVGEHEGKHFIVMDLVEGPSFKKLVDDRKEPLGRLVGHLRDVARAVQFAHDHGILHRDLKPANILIEKDGRPVVTDFGLAKDLARSRSGGHTETGDVFGTPAYMSPEQAAGRSKHVDARSDVYSLGAVLYYLLTGRPPFQGESTLHEIMLVATADPEFPSRVNPDVPPGLERVCLRAMEKSSVGRYPTAGALADDLERHLLGQPVSARASPFTQRAWLRVRRRWMPLALAASLALLLGAALFAGIGQFRRAAERAELRSRAAHAYAAGDFLEALRCFERLSALDPGDAESRRLSDDCARRLRPDPR